MNILPHKSWHVRRKDNIERVRRDEAKAAEEEKERQRKIALAEQEARTELLRNRSKKRLTEKDVSDSIHPSPHNPEETNLETSVDIYNGTRGHINFFKDAEDGIADKKKNTEHEKEKKEEREKWEKNMGILTYLGQSAQDPTPWYMNKKRKREDDEDSERKDRDKKRKHHMDPIHDLNRYVDKTREVHSPDKHKHKHKSKKKHKHKSKEKEKSQSCSKSSSKTMDQLRAERMKREAEERKKTADLIARLRGETTSDKTETVELSDRRRGYNSQYNPDFVRQPKDRR